jgi:hypothetical protein
MLAPAEPEGTMSSCLKRTLARTLAASAFALCAASTAIAAVVTADLTRVAGNTWDASFTVRADPGQTVEAFSIYFDWTQVSNLVVWASPADWDSLTLQADAALASDGIFDTLTLADGIAEGNSLGGFTARFDWADAAGPSMLRFTVNDPVTFDSLETGVVTSSTGDGGGTQMPEPGTAGLLLAALVGLLVRSRDGRRLRVPDAH